MILAPKEQHKEMTTILLSSFIDQKYCENAGKKLKLQVLNRLGCNFSWKYHLAVEYQGSYRPVESETVVILDEIKIQKQDMLWEPIIGEWVRQDRIKSAHNVPRSRRDAYIRSLFGVQNYEGFLMDARNGLIMLSCLEEAFNRGEFIIVPTGRVDGSNHIELQCRVLRYANLQSKGGKRTFIYRRSPDHPPLYWDDIHERILQFPKECTLRPYRRCFFHQALGAVLHCQQLKLTGYEEIGNHFVSGSMWATPEKYLEKSFLQRTWDLIGADKMPDGLDRFLFLGIAGHSEEQTHADSQMFASNLMDRFSGDVNGFVDEEDGGSEAEEE
jgi:hypothetical protein